MTVLTEVQVKLAEQLLLTIKNKEMNVTYSELAERIDPPIHHRQVGKNIGQVSLLCHELGLPLISAKVVNKYTNTAGEGFYPLYQMLGIPTNGKTEKELYEAERKAIRECTEWYKLEDYLGLDIGLPRPTPKVPKRNPSLLDAQAPVPYSHSVDVLNECFGTKLLGKQYDAWMKGAIDFEAAGKTYTIWFPKLSTDGTAASSSGWINAISPDGKIIEEYGSEKTYESTDDLRLVFAKSGSSPYRFVGVFAADNSRSTIDHHYFIKVADVADFTGDAPAIHFFDEEEKSDDLLVEALKGGTEFTPVADFQYAGKPVSVPKPQVVGNRIIYPRNHQTAINALSHAKFRCEIDPNHQTFLRRQSMKPYTEPHHLIPISRQDRFSVSLDVEENIVSLCSTCHNHIHYGAGAEDLLLKLFHERKELLRSVGIEVTEDELLSFYE